MVETGQFDSGLVEVDSVVGRFALGFLIAVAVVDDDPTHLRILFGPIFALALVGVFGVLVGGLVGGVAVGEVVEVG